MKKEQYKSSIVFKYAIPNKPTEEEILQKEAMGFTLFGWERSILHYANVRRSMYDNQKHCAYCNVELVIEDATIDHKIPRSRGGTDATENLTLACFTCNQTKRAMTVDEFAATDNGKNMPPKPNRFDSLRERRRLNYINFQVMFYARAPLC